jgi:putative drug exporter of the RND superfamily
VFARLGRWCHDRRWFVVVGWVVLLFVVNGVAGAAGKDYRSEFTLPDVESRQGVDLLDEHFGGQGSGSSGSIVFQADQGVDDPDVQAAMEEMFVAIGGENLDGRGGIDGIVGVSSPYDPDNSRQISSRDGLAGQVAYAGVDIDGDVPWEDVQTISDEIDEATPHIDGLTVIKGGEIFAEVEVPSSEALGVAFAIFILILAFGSVLAMGLPIGVALAGIGVGSAIGAILTHALSIPDFAEQLGMMIGLGVGIDYALFIVTRFRENLHNGQDVRQATTVAINTAGRAVAFAGTTVVISLMGMLLMGLPFVTGLATAAAVVVALTMLASLTLLPAFLGLINHRLEVTRWRGLVAAGLVAVALIGAAFKTPAVALPAAGLAALTIVAGFLPFFPGPQLRSEVKRRERRDLRRTLAYRWSRGIQHRPWTAAIAGAVILVVLALPLFGLRLGFPDEGNYPEDTETREAYDLLADGFGPGFNGPFMLAAQLPSGTSEADLEPITQALRQADGVDREAVSPAVVSDDGEAVRWMVTPETAPQDKATTDLVHHLRDDVLPAATEGTGIDVSVAGTVPVNVDFSSYLAERMPYFLGAVLLLSFVLLMVVFRSLLVPLKAVVMNLLSIGAAYGVIVAAFQWGWAGPVLGIDSAPIEPFIPMMLFAIVFGLSMDYEVFLLSRVKEEWDRTGDSHVSVADGLAATARVITAAAAIMVFVFGSFLLEDLRLMKLFGMGLAVAVLLDATVVRMLLVPATMELLGDRNWWLPRWLGRLLPKIDVEGHGTEPGLERPAGGERELERV